MPIGTGNKLILAFVTLLVGIIFVGIVATQSLERTDKEIATDEAIDITDAWLGTEINETYPFTITNNPTSWKSDDCPLTGVTVGNSTTDYTVTTDYVMTASTGVITYRNTSNVRLGTNNTLLDYTYCSDGYMNLSWGRSILNLLGGFFALALLGVSLGLFWSIAKDYNIM